MRLRDLRDVYSGQEIYIVGSGPTANLFPKEFLADKICLSLNDSFKIHPNITPIALMHHQIYSRNGKSLEDEFHPNFRGIKYPVAKGTGKHRAEKVDWDNPHFYFFDWNHNIDQIYEMTKNTDCLYYTPEGCDSTTLGGRHYANYDKNNFRDDEVLKRGQSRNYDSYVKGSLIVQDFLRRKGVQVLNLSPIVGYHMVDYQYEVLLGNLKVEDIVSEFLVLDKEKDAS